MKLHMHKSLASVCLVGLAAAGVSAQTAAQTQPQPQVQAQSLQGQSRTYMGAAVTAPNYSSSINAVGGGGGGDGPGMKFYGGYKLTPNFALEGGVYELGRSNNNGGTARAYGTFVDGVASTRITPDWSAYGSVGVTQARFHTPAGNDSSPGLKVGAGLQYDFSQTTALRVGYERYRFTSAFGEKPLVGQTSVGLNFGF